MSDQNEGDRRQKTGDSRERKEGLAAIFAIPRLVLWSDLALFAVPLLLDVLVFAGVYAKVVLDAGRF
jgi:hypothetical protein